MTNLQQGARPRSLALRTGLLIGLPAAVGAVLGGLVLVVGVFQPWNQLRRDQFEVEDLRAMEQRLPVLRTQRVRQEEEIAVVERQRARLLQLIAGSGEFSTFLAQLDREAAATGVQLDVYEPVAPVPATTPPAGDKAKDDTKAAPPPDPLEADGLSRTSLQLSARGRYPNLLVFLRRLESLGLLVVQSDLNLDLEEVRPPAAAAPGRPAAAPPPVPRVVLKINLGLYGEAPPAADTRPARAGTAPPGAVAPPAPPPVPAPASRQS